MSLGTPASNTPAAACMASIPLVTFGDSTPAPLSLSFGCDVVRSQRTRWAAVHTLSRNVPQHICLATSFFTTNIWNYCIAEPTPRGFGPRRDICRPYLHFTVCALEPSGPNLNANAPACAVSSLPQAELPKCLTAEDHKMSATHSKIRRFGHTIRQNGPRHDVRQSLACRADPGSLLACLCREVPFPCPAFSVLADARVLHMHVNIRLFCLLQTTPQITNDHEIITSPPLGLDRLDS